MECAGRCVAISESSAPSIFGRMYRKFGNLPELRQLARDVIRWECRPYPTMQPPPLAYFLKTSVANETTIPLFKYITLMLPYFTARGIQKVRSMA